MQSQKAKRAQALEAIVRRREEELAKETPRESRKTQRQAARHRIPRREIARLLGARIAREKLDYIENFITVYRRQVEDIRKLPKARERKRQLARFGAALETILENNKTADLFFLGTEEFTHLKRAAKSLLPIVKFSLQKKLKKGPDRDERTPVILELARIFEAQPGRAASISYDPMSGCFRSPFFSFVRVCFPTGDPFATDTALGAAVRNALKTRRTNTK